MTRTDRSDCRVLLAGVNLPIVDELGYVPISWIGSEVLFEVFNRRQKNAGTDVSLNLAFRE